MVKARRGRETKVYARVRSGVASIPWHLPEDKVRQFCKDKGEGRGERLHPTQKPAWLQRRAPAIMLAYHAERRGVAHSDRLAPGAK